MSATMRNVAAAVCCAAVVLSVGAQDAPQAKSTYFEEAKITVNERARADGYLRVRVQPENGTALEATIDVLKRMSENDIVKGMTEALQAVLGPDYEVDRDGGEHIKIKKAERATANFAVEVAFSAPGFAVILDN